MRYTVARGATLLLKGKRRQPDENFVLPTGSRVHLRKIPGKCLYCAHNDNGSRSIRGKKYASIESLGLAFCVSGRTRHLSMKESIAAIFFPLYYLYRSCALISRVFHVAIFVKECFYLVALLFTTFSFLYSKKDQKVRYD